MLFLVFGFIKSLFGTLTACYSAIHIFIVCAVYKKSDFTFYLFLLAVGLKGTLIYRYHYPNSRLIKWMFGIIGAAFAMALMAANNFEYYFFQYFGLHAGMMLVYILPLFFFYVHLRTQLILIYKNVDSLENLQRISKGQSRRQQKRRNDGLDGEAEGVCCQSPEVSAKACSEIRSYFLNWHLF